MKIGDRVAVWMDGALAFGVVETVNDIVITVALGRGQRLTLSKQQVSEGYVPLDMDTVLGDVYGKETEE